MLTFRIGLALTVSVVAVLMSIACTPGETPPPGTSLSGAFEDVTWVLQGYGDPAALTPVLPDREVTIRFERATGDFGGNAGVNLYGGTYTVDGDKLRITSPITRTKMAGPAPLMAQEDAFLNILQSAESCRVSKGRLTISGGGRALAFARQATPIKPT